MAIIYYRPFVCKALNLPIHEKRQVLENRILALQTGYLYHYSTKRFDCLAKRLI
jgi:hypothetical protein